MSEHGFTSVFAADLDSYLQFKETLGCQNRSRVWYLRTFDTYCVAHDRTVFDRETVEGWVIEHLERWGGRRSWMSYVRDLGRWLRVRGRADAYVLSDRWKTAPAVAHPYLLSGREIEAFFTAASCLQARSPWRWQAVAFFALMCCCGLRTGEGRLLRVEHVHLADRRIDVICSKGNRSRRLPLSGELTGVLAVCDRISRKEFGPARRTFFVSAAGNELAASSVGQVFNRVWDEAHLPRPAGGQRPRPYDFRHHFAYANVERWAAEGRDVAAMLPYLARYMGHASIQASYYYIHTSPDFMDAYAQITAQISTLVLPEVGFQ